jgi:CheY-like chemotaxis protein
MNDPIGPCLVLMAEDDPDDRLMIETAFKESGIAGSLRFVEDGEELMVYLRNPGEHDDEGFFSRPRLLLLDLNMPRKDGRAALAEIRQDPSLRDLPVVVVTTSDAQRDRKYCEQYDVIDYVNKPTSIEELAHLVEIIRRICTG